MTKIECYRSQSVKKLCPVLDAWAHNHYREYPYLYVYQNGNDYHAIFEEDPTSFV